MNKFCIITPPRTGSTLLTNIIHGFFDPNAPCSFGLRKRTIKFISGKENNSVILKSHDVKLINYPIAENCYIISSIRPEINKVVPPLKNKNSNILILDYTTDLLYASPYSENNGKTLDDVIKNVASKIKEEFSIPILTSQINQAKDRVLKMNEAYEKIKHKPFAKFDEFYHIHGNHRNRGR